jgi:hypothetical protein
MTFTRLKYRSKLGYPSANLLPALSDADLQAARNTWLVSFRKPLHGDADRIVPKVSATVRVAPPPGTSDVTLHALEADSPLAPLIFWDIAHALPVGATITVVEPSPGARYFDRDYFRDALALESKTPTVQRYRKVARLDAESGSLDEWTFGIPTGPEDATLLNACVARILELDIPRKEIVLCGRPGANFKYWDYVRIVGEDITAPPVQICKKKNRIASEATFENLCIIHDRVFLPHNFGEMVRKFGNAYSLTAVQSMYFDDRFNFAARRYSDTGVGLRLSSHITEGLARSDAVETSRYSTATLANIESTGFVFANAHRSSPSTYPTGSLYLCKKKVWMRAPQDERLMWTEFEDIEQGERAAALGIPSRVNPHAITQSMISRPILNWLGAAICEKPSGGVRTHRTLFDAMPWIPRKPLLKKTLEQAAVDYAKFMSTWGVAPDANIEPISSATVSTKRRLRWMVQVVHAVRLPLRRDRLLAFLKDFEKLVVSEQVPYGWHVNVANEFAHGGQRGIPFLLSTCQEVFNHASQRPKGRIFAKTLEDYLPSSPAAVLFGSLVSAFFLARRNNDFLVLPAGYWWKVRAILGSTPFVRYARTHVAPRGEIISKTKAVTC